MLDVTHKPAWMKRPRLQRIVGRSRLLRRCTIGLLARLELRLLAGHKDPAVLRILRESRRRAESLLTGNEAFLLYALARAQRGLGAAMAELGVYQGSSARILCEAKGGSALHLFDTFTGLPEPARAEKPVLAQGQFAASLPAVRALLAGYGAVHFHPGLFPASAAAVQDTRFSLVHLDVDLYASTLAGLQFFYPRLLAGGIIVSHDYSMLPGVAEAFATFLSDKPEAVIELPTTQAMLVKR
jgi:hypothetical protein